MASEPTSPTSPTTPTSPTDDHEATKEWLETILEGYHRSKNAEADLDLELREWTINPASADKEGFLSEQLSMTVNYVAEGEEHHAHLLAKLLPQDPFNRAFVIETLFDVREIKFYTEIKPELEEVERKYLTEDFLSSSWAPKLYYAKHKQASESILVLEDMCQHGYQVEDLTKGLSQDQIKAAITALANVHAAAVALEVKEKKPLKERYPYLLSMEQAVESFTCLVDRGLPLLLKFLESRKDYAAVREGLQKYQGQKMAADVFRKVLTPSERINTLVHCDYWCNNLLFKNGEERTDCCIIDWQMVTYGRPAIDLAFLISTSLETGERRKHCPELLSHYWQAFTSRLSKYDIKQESHKYSREDLEADFKAAQTMAGLVVVGSVDIALGFPAREERVLELLADLLKGGIL
ncbi:uncharacterized protein LOC134774113 [Penaeus indicus]|uniref:uncharacterized protein LOC134774113 n=1 Tax=Penaeus indicus TaxID=29960 RepID=UPI00300CE840